MPWTHCGHAAWSPVAKSEANQHVVDASSRFLREVPGDAVVTMELVTALRVVGTGVDSVTLPRETV